MMADQEKGHNAEMVLFDDRTRSMDSTTIMANTEESRHKKTIQIPTFHDSRNETSKTQTALTESQKKKKERSSLLDRLTIVNVETSSSRSNKKKKGRRKSAPRNHKPLPDELLLRHGQPDSVSQIPDSFSNSNTFSKDETDAKMTHDQVPVLFTFDLVPSLSEDSLSKQNVPGGNNVYNNTTDANIDNDSATRDTGIDTTDANIGEEEDDDLSGIFDEFEESDNACVKHLEGKYNSQKLTTDADLENVTALTKLELTTRTRTDSTAFLSEVSSNDLYTQQVEKANTETSLQRSKSDEKLLDKASQVPQDDLHIKASRCISLNIFSIFD